MRELTKKQKKTIGKQESSDQEKLNFVGKEFVLFSLLVKLLI